MAALCLREQDFDPDPMKQFRAWLEDALNAKLVQPLGMTLATAGRNCKPSARMVLLRGLDEKGFVFFTNYDSRKSGELDENPWASLVFYWAELDRQVRVEGPAERVSKEESDAYYQTRARGSQLGAWASPQSQVVPDRAFLDRSMQEFAARYQTGPVPRPPHWGGYRVIPDLIEFWQGQENRLHDRLRYRKLESGTWLLERLAP
jgi:pyridoxamine 5'-phosphate oxidase